MDEPFGHRATGRRPPGRHLRQRPRRRIGAGQVAAVAAVLGLLGAGVLVVRMLDAGRSIRPTVQATAATSPTPAIQRPSQDPPPGQGVFGNLVLNWSFEEDLRGWTVMGEASGSREPVGRTSGSSARLELEGTGVAGLRLTGVAAGVGAGRRFVATVWVRSGTPGTPVSVRLVSRPAGGRDAVSETRTKTAPASEWSRVRVAHEVPADGSDLRFEVTTTGRSLVIDEVTIREG